MSAIRAIPPARTRSVVLIVNGNATGSTFRRQELGRLVAAFRRAGARADVRLTAGIDELAMALADHPGQRIVLVGGDGTVHAAVNLERPPRELALVPAGRANNIARSLGIPLDWDAAARLAATGCPRPVDLIAARSAGRRRLVVEGVSVGFLARARVRYHAGNSGDVVAGLRAGAAALAGFHPLAVTVAAGAGAERLGLAQLFVANLPLYEFGLRVAPHASVTDGMLDLVGVEAASRRAVLAMILELRRGTLFEHPGVHLWRAGRIEIETHGSSPIVGDSTDLGSGPVELSAAPGALRLVRP